ncbi:Helix-turn-helix domain protein [compost metagenome]
MKNKSDHLLRDPQAADYLAVSIAWLQRQRWLGTGPVYVKVGSRAVRYRLSDLEAWVNQNVRRGSSAEATR